MAVVSNLVSKRVVPSRGEGHAASELEMLVNVPQHSECLYTLSWQCGTPSTTQPLLEPQPGERRPVTAQVLVDPAPSIRTAASHLAVLQQSSSGFHAHLLTRDPGCGLRRSVNAGSGGGEGVGLVAVEASWGMLRSASNEQRGASVAALEGARASAIDVGRCFRPPCNSGHALTVTSSSTTSSSTSTSSGPEGTFDGYGDRCAINKQFTRNLHMNGAQVHVIHGDRSTRSLRSVRNGMLKILISGVREQGNWVQLQVGWEYYMQFINLELPITRTGRWISAAGTGATSSVGRH